MQHFEVGELKLCNIYIPPGNEPSPAESVRFLERLSSRSLIVGDCNAHHRIWSKRTPNPRGLAISKVIEEQSLVLLNCVHPTRFNLTSNAVNERWSLLDLTIASMDLAHRCEAKVSDLFFGSDHCIITTHIDCKSDIETSPIQRWNLKKANWEVFSKHASTHLSNIENTTDVNRLNNEISSALLRAASKTIPKISSNCRFKNPVPWWNDRCKNAVELKKEAFKKMKRSWDPQSIIIFKKLRAECRKTILNAKRESWRTFCDSLNRKENLTKVWKVASSFFGRNKLTSIPALIQGDTVTNDEAKANLIGQIFSDVSSPQNFSNSFLRRKTYFEENTFPNLTAINEPMPNMDDSFSMEELKRALMKKKNTSPGHDGISYDMLKHLDQESLEKVLKLINRSWTAGKVPTSWQHATVVPILKPGKIATSPHSYRPISLTSHISKTMETMIADRLKWYLEKKGIFSPTQYGFRHNRCTLDHILKFHHQVSKNISEKGM